MPSKIGFRVIHASSQDDSYRASQLNAHSPTTKGWQSSRFCLYPQDIVLQLESRVRLCKIQILSHQYLIASKIELFIGDAPPGTQLPSQNARYKRLGYVELSDNEKTEFRARELKSIHVDAVGQFVKFLIHKNHVNQLNIFNKVGIVAINVIGDPLFPFGDKAIDPVHAPEPDRQDYISPLDDLAFDLYQDPEIAHIIRKLERKKQDAVLHEQYEYAKQLKGAIQDLHQAGKKLGKYEVEKRRAVEEENYDLAKSKKVQMDEYRQQVYEELHVTELLESDGVVSVRNRDNDKQSLPTRAVRVEPIELEDDRTARHPPAQGPPVQNNTYTDQQSYDERPIPTLAKLDKQISPRTSPSERNLETERTAVQEKDPKDTDRSAGIPEPLNSKDEREAFEVIDVFGMPLTSKVFSKTWSFREDALIEIYNKMNQLPASPDDLNTPSNMLRAATVVINRSLKDNVMAVFLAAVNLERMVLSSFVKKHKISRSETTTFVEQTFPGLLLRTGDTAHRQRDAAKDFIIEASELPEIKPLNVVTRECIEPFKPSVPARLALSRVELVDQLYATHGLKDSGLTLENMMKFLTVALGHTSGSDVRHAAEQVIIKLYREVGSPVKDFLPPDCDKTRRNVLYNQLFIAFDKIDGIHKKDNKPPKKTPQPPESNRSVDLRKSSVPIPANNEQRKSSVPVSVGKAGNGKTSVAENKSHSVPERLCIFCDERNDAFTEEGLDLHYWKHCPMLTRCPQCKVVVEIAELTSHCLDGCDKMSEFIRCPNCSEAYTKAESKNHGTNNCLPFEKGKARCPLCHSNFEMSEETWKQHLTGKNGCAANPRRSEKMGKANAVAASTNLKRPSQGVVSRSPGRQSEATKPVGTTRNK